MTETLIPIEDFEKLTRDKMVEELRRTAPQRAKGLSRATKQSLAAVYRAVMEEKLLSSTGDPVLVDVMQEGLPADAAESGPILMNVDYPALESRALARGNTLAAVEDAHATEKGIEPLPPGLGLLRDQEVRVGGGAPTTLGAPVGLLRGPSRREAVYKEVSKLGKERIRILAKYKAAYMTNDPSRRVRRARHALLKRVLRFLPSGVSVSEAMEVLA